MVWEPFLPKIVDDRIKKELKSIIGMVFPIYLIAQKLCIKE